MTDVSFFYIIGHTVWVLPIEDPSQSNQKENSFSIDFLYSMGDRIVTQQKLSKQPLYFQEFICPQDPGLICSGSCQHRIQHRIWDLLAFEHWSREDERCTTVKWKCHKQSNICYPFPKKKKKEKEKLHDVSRRVSQWWHTRGIAVVILVS